MPRLSCSVRSLMKAFCGGMAAASPSVLDVHRTTTHARWEKPGIKTQLSPAHVNPAMIKGLRPQRSLEYPRREGRKLSIRAAGKRRTPAAARPLSIRLVEHEKYRADQVMQR